MVMPPFRIEPDTLGLLVDRITFEMVEENNRSVLRDVLAGQVAIVTTLEAENAALRDAYQSLRRSAVQFATAVVGDDDPPSELIASYGDLLDELYPPDAQVTLQEQTP